MRLDRDIEQLKAALAAKIIGILDDRKLTVREAAKLTGVAAADFSRIRNVKLDRYHRSLDDGPQPLRSEGGDRDHDTATYQDAERPQSGMTR